MKTLKTILMALAMASAPALVLPSQALAQTPAGQSATPATKAAAAATPATTAAMAPPVAGQTPTETAPAASAGTIKGNTPEKAPAAAKAPDIDHFAPTDGIGQPIPGGWKLQPQVTDVGRDAEWMHNVVLMPIITVISVFVLFLLLYVVVRFRASANPVPSKTSHNTVIEIVWTLLPVLILLVIAVPSIKLLAKQYSPPKADLTVKVLGNQWYWTYEYPDNGDFTFDSNYMKEKSELTAAELAKGVKPRTDADGPRLLAVDNRMVVPVNAVVKIITTSNDVIHSFAVPAFWTKMDAVPGRLNETWFKVDREGVYFGQCSELCGPKHGYMPIAVEVVSKEKFAQWVASKGGTMPGVKGSPTDAAAKAQGGTTAATPSQPTATTLPPTTNAATAAPATSSQPATTN
jgi:cytochrome c oxidase subunit II